MPVDIPMTVTIFADKAMVNPPSVKVPRGETGNLTWTPEGENVTIDYIGFASQVGPGNQIEELAEQPDGKWTATDKNSVKGILTFYVWARAGDQVFSSDPQIVNEGPPDDVEPPPWESKP